jgi:hypothetical protein
MSARKVFRRSIVRTSLSSCSTPPPPSRDTQEPRLEGLRVLGTRRVDHVDPFSKSQAVAGGRLRQQNPHQVAAAMIICPQNAQGTRATSGGSPLRANERTASSTWLPAAAAGPRRVWLRHCRRQPPGEHRCGEDFSGPRGATETQRRGPSRSPFMAARASHRRPAREASGPFPGPAGRPWCRSRSPLWALRLEACLVSVRSG